MKKYQILLKSVEETYLKGQEELNRVGLRPEIENTSKVKKRKFLQYITF